MEIDQLITDTLLKMKADLASFLINPSDDSYNQLIMKYNTIFSGEKFNKVFSVEVANHLNISNSILNKHIEKVANNLNMNLEELVTIENIGNVTPDAYYIELI